MSSEEPPTNWGRWGAEDQLGTLNLVDDQARSRAAAEVQTGHHVSLARVVDPVPLTTGMSPVGSSATMPSGVLRVMNFNGFKPLAVTDSLLINTHNAGLTHLDAVAHMPVSERIYPGVPVGEAITAAGVRHGSADPFGKGIVTRGVFLDLAPGARRLSADHRVGAADLDEALRRSGVSSLQSGDAVALRAGWDTDQPAGVAVPGLDLSAVRWLDEQGVSVYLSDIGDSRPPRFPLPVHQVALARLGMPLVDAADLTELASTCQALHRSSFMLVLAPPRITGATGLVVNPIAVF